VHACMRRRNAVCRRIIISGAGDFLASDNGIVARVLEFEAEFPHQAGNDDVVILEQGQAADAFSRFEGTVP